MPKYFTLLLLCMLWLGASAQTWEIGGSVGGTGYIGDLNTNNYLKPGGGYGGVFIKRNFNPYLAIRLNYVYGQISGADSTSSVQQLRQRNLSFIDPLKELSMVLEFNFMSYVADAGKNKYTPYVFLGGGITGYAPRAWYNGQLFSLRYLQTEGVAYGSKTLVIPFGAGFKYNIGGKWTLGAELGYRYTNTDYLDDVSGVYKGVFTNDTARRLADRSGEINGGVNIGTPGSQRGDLKLRDFYSFFGLTLSYTFVTSKCYY